jgi:hypothetical protein
MDLAGGRYPDFEQEWLLDGQPSPPYRRSISRGDINATSATGAATTVPYVVAVPAQVGDVINYVSFGIGALSSAPGNGSFVVLYSGMPTAGAPVTVLGASAAAAYTAGANKIALSSPVTIAGTVGTPQNAAGSGMPNAAVVLGVAIVEAWGTAASTYDAMAGGSSAFKGVLSGQLPLVTKLPALAAPPAVGSSSGTTVTAPTTGLVPYVVLSRS